MLKARKMYLLFKWVIVTCLEWMDVEVHAITIAKIFIDCKGFFFSYFYCWKVGHCVIVELGDDYTKLEPRKLVESYDLERTNDIVKYCSYINVSNWHCNYVTHDALLCFPSWQACGAVMWPPTMFCVQLDHNCCIIWSKLKKFLPSLSSYYQHTVVKNGIF